MNSPFDQKNKLARALDRSALRALLLALSVGYFYFLWRSGPASLLGGGALFTLILLSLLLIERRTLSRREALLRERVGGMIALDELILLPSGAAGLRVRDLLCSALDAQPVEGGACMRWGGEVFLVRCAQCLQGSSISEGDVLGAHRARIESGADRCVLAATGGVSPAATRAAQWVDPPVRLLSGRQLAQLFGRVHPATDEEIARHAARQKKPYTLARIRALALSPAKLRRHLLCAFLLLAFYLITGSLAALCACLLSFTLALLCKREKQFTL